MKRLVLEAFSLAAVALVASLSESVMYETLSSLVGEWREWFLHFRIEDYSVRSGDIVRASLMWITNEHNSGKRLLGKRTDRWSIVDMRIVPVPESNFIQNTL